MSTDKIPETGREDTALAAVDSTAAASSLKFDVRTTPAYGTTGEIVVQVGPEWSWCQGGLWTWTNPGSSRTVKERITDIHCPVGVELDLTDVRAVWVFLNGREVYIDNIRAE